MKHTQSQSVSEKFSVGHGYSITFQIKNHALQVTWFPDFPPQNHLQKIIASGQCYAARHTYLSDYTSQTGVAVLCIDVGGEK